MTDRIHHPQAYRRLKTALNRVLADHGGGAAAARMIRVRTDQSLYNYRDQQRPDCHVPADIIADLEANADHPHITQVLAELQGYILAPGPDLFKGEGCAFEALRQSGEFISELSIALANGGGVDRSEAPGVLRQAAEALSAVAGVVEELQTRFPDLTGGPAPSRKRRVMVTEEGTFAQSSGASAPSGGPSGPARGRACGGAAAGAGREGGQGE